MYLIDAFAVDDMKPIGEVLADETVVKVIQGADYDIRCLDREWGFRVRNLFDTFIAGTVCRTQPTTQFLGQALSPDLLINTVKEPPETVQEAPLLKSRLSSHCCSHPKVHRLFIYL